MLGRGGDAIEESGEEKKRDYKGEAMMMPRSAVVFCECRRRRGKMFNRRRMGRRCKLISSSNAVRRRIVMQNSR